MTNFPSLLGPSFFHYRQSGAWFGSSATMRRSWSLLLPINDDLGYLDGPPQNSHVGLIVLTFFGASVTR